MRVCDGLGFNPLSRVDQQQGAFARRQTAGHFVGEIHVARGVHQVELIRYPIFGRISHGDWVALNRDASLPLQVHRVEMLFG